MTGLRQRPALNHPEEMTASVDVRAGSVSLQANARATPAGFVGIALLLLSAAALVWAMRHRPDQP